MCVKTQRRTLTGPDHRQDTTANGRRRGPCVRTRTSRVSSHMHVISHRREAGHLCHTHDASKRVTCILYGGHGYGYIIGCSPYGMATTNERVRFNSGCARRRRRSDARWERRWILSTPQSVSQCVPTDARTQRPRGEGSSLLVPARSEHGSNGNGPLSLLAARVPSGCPGHQ